VELMDQAISQRDFRKNVASIFHEHKQLAAASPHSFFSTLKGADLWIDGYDCINSTSYDVFNIYLDAFFLVIEEIDKRKCTNYASSFVGLLSVFDKYLEACCEKSQDNFWPALSVGICIVHALGGPPNISEKPCSIVNDTLLLLLSKNYRSIRTRAYNYGAVLEITAAQDDQLFRPELGIVPMGPPISIADSDFPKVQFYNIAHEFSHLVNFGDVYIRPYGSLPTTAELLLNAEEANIGMDLLMMQEMNRFKPSLHASSEFRGIQPGEIGPDETSVATIASEHPALLKNYQLGLRAIAQLELNTQSSIGKELSNLCIVPDDINLWISSKSRKKHIDGAWTIANRVHSRPFRELVSLLPQDSDHHANLLSTLDHVPSTGEVFLGQDTVEPSRNLRQSALLYHRARALVINAGEIASSIMNNSGHYPAILMDELLHWSVSLAMRCHQANGIYRSPPLPLIQSKERELLSLLYRHTGSSAHEEVILNSCTRDLTNTCAS